MTAPTPPLVDVIAEVLRVHVKRNIKGCDCGWAELGKSHWDHQARAVLAAISEAGAVADPEVCGHALDSQGAEFGPKSPCTKPTGHNQYHRDNTGVAFGPYQGDPNE